MAAAETMTASAYPLDLAKLKREAEKDANECALIHNAGLGTGTPDLLTKELTSSQPKTIGLVLHPRKQVFIPDMTGLFNQGVALVVWKQGARQTDIQKRSLWAASRSGIWNHLIFSTNPEGAEKDLLVFALNNPNIIHSYSFNDHSSVLPPADIGGMIKSLPGYQRVTPLPGVPIWKKMETLERLLSFLHKFGLKQMQNWLVMENSNRVYCLGESLQYHYSHPADLPVGFFEEICRMVESGGSVDMQKVRTNLERAFLIGYALEFGLIVGNSSLKEPRPEYIQSLNQNTGLDFTGFLERGYTSVRPEYRGMGIGTKLLEGLTNRTQGRQLYSVIAEDNLATQKIAIRNKTRKLTTFFSEKAGKQVGVWVKD